MDTGIGGIVVTIVGYFANGQRSSSLAMDLGTNIISNALNTLLFVLVVNHFTGRSVGID